MSEATDCPRCGCNHTAQIDRAEVLLTDRAGKRRQWTATRWQCQFCGRRWWRDLYGLEQQPAEQPADQL